MYDAGDFVVKAPQGDRGRRCNVGEAAFWRDAATDVREYLAPVLAAAPDGSWLVMRKAHVTRDWAIADQVRDAIGGHVDDLHAANVGLLDGRPVAIDYCPPWAVGAW